MEWIIIAGGFQEGPSYLIWEQGDLSFLIVFFDTVLGRKHHRKFQNDRSTISFVDVAIEVAEHSFCTRSCWCDSVRAQLRIAKQKIKHAVDSVIILFSEMPASSVLFSFIIERNYIIVLVFYFKNMLEKVSMRRTQHTAILRISFVTERGACDKSQKMQLNAE